MEQAPSVDVTPGIAFSPDPRAAAETVAPLLGIWRLGEPLHRGESTDVRLAQPADAAGSPRWDYVVKRVVSSAADWEGRQEINRQIAVGSAISHPHLVAILDGSASAATPYVVMPKVEGQSMQRLLATGPAQPLPVVLWLVRQAAEGLAALHRAGWIHGDVKPANLIVSPSGHVTIVDLGFATPVNTPLGPVFRGTPEYASPELLEGKLAALPEMDLFALGRVLWRWLLHLRHVERGPAGRELLEPVAGLVESLVSADPRQRPSADHVAKELLALEIQTLGCHIGPRWAAA